MVGSITEIIQQAKDNEKPVLMDPFLPWPVDDREGMGIALLMLEKSREKGINNASYVQFDSYQKLCSAAFNVFLAYA